MAYNHKRTGRFQAKSTADLKSIAMAGTLGSAAAIYELAKRGITGVGYIPGSHPKKDA